MSLAVDYNGDGELSFVSDNTKIAVDEDGLVTIPKNFSGKATITVSASSTDRYEAASAISTVTVKALKNMISVEDITVDASMNDTETELGATAKGGTLSYESDVPEIIVSSDGIVTVKAGFVGEAEITVRASASGAYKAAVASAVITVQPIKNTITASSVSKTTSASAQTFKLSVKQKGSGKLTYKSSSSSVKVANTGKVTIAKNFAGQAVITVKAVASGIYQAASKIVTIKVSPASVTIGTAKNISGQKIALSWKKAIGATGYQIQYSTSKSFKSGVKSVTVKSAATLKGTLKKLTKGKTYYIRIRSYKKETVGNLYSKWTSFKAVKVTK